MVPPYTLDLIFIVALAIGMVFQVRVIRQAAAEIRHLRKVVKDRENTKKAA